MKEGRALLNTNPIKAPQSTGENLNSLPKSLMEIFRIIPFRSVDISTITIEKELRILSAFIISVGIKKRFKWRKAPPISNRNAKL